MVTPIMPDKTQARALLDTIGWHDVRMESVPGGSVNTTFRLTEDRQVWYLRIGPTDDEVASGPTWFTGKGLRREQQAIALWSSHAHVLPETVHRDFTHQHIPADWVIQKAIVGDPWEAVHSRLDQEQTAGLWQEFGRLLAQLHAYTGEEFGPPEPGHGHQRWSDLCRWDATGLLTDARRYGLPVAPFQRLCELVDRSSFELDEVTSPRLVHSDLGLRHVMIVFDERYHPSISGVIDLEFARFADPYSETIFVAEGLEAQRDPMFEKFLSAYGAERQDRNSRLRGLIYQLISLGWGASDAMRRNRPGETRAIIETMQKRLGSSRQVLGG